MYATSLQSEEDLCFGNFSHGLRNVVYSLKVQVQGTCIVILSPSISSGRGRASIICNQHKSLCFRLPLVNNGPFLVCAETEILQMCLFWPCIRRTLCSYNTEYFFKTWGLALWFLSLILLLTHHFARFYFLMSLP